MTNVPSTENHDIVEAWITPLGDSWAPTNCLDLGRGIVRARKPPLKVCKYFRTTRTEICHLAISDFSEKSINILFLSVHQAIQWGCCEVVNYSLRSVQWNTIHKAWESSGVLVHFSGFHLEKLARGGKVKSLLKKGGITLVKMRGVVT